MCNDVIYIVNNKCRIHIVVYIIRKNQVSSNKRLTGGAYGAPEVWENLARSPPTLFGSDGFKEYRVFAKTLQRLTAKRCLFYELHYQAISVLMDVILPPLSEEKESLNVNQVIGIVRTISNFTFIPKEDQNKQIEYITKLEKLITSDEDGDYVVEKIFHKDNGCIQALLKFIAVCCYPHVVFRSFTLIHKCVSQKRNIKGSLARRMSTTFIFDEGQVLINVLMNIEDQLEFVGCSPKIINSTYFYLLSILDIACKRDKKFCRYFDRYHVLKKLLYLFGKYNKSFKMSVILIDIFRCLIKTRNANEFTANRSFFENLESIFTMFKSKRSPKIKSMVIFIKLLTRNEDIHESIFDTKIISYLLQILVNDDNLPVSYTMYKSIVLSISKIIKKESFLECFKTNANIRLLYRFCSHFAVTEDKHHIILLKACSIIHACLPKHSLLADNTKLYTFPIPTIKRTAVQCQNSMYEDEEGVSTLSEDSDAEEDDDDELEDDDEKETDQNVIINNNNNNENATGKDWKRILQLQDSVQYTPATMNLYTANAHKLSTEQSFDQMIAEENNKIKIFEKLSANMKQNNIYCTLASSVNTKRQFVKVAYPDMTAAQCVPQPQYLLTNYSKFSRTRLLDLIDRAFDERAYNNHQIVYDLDELQKHETIDHCDLLKCDDLNNLVSSTTNSSSLKFESRFEGGNLRKAYKVSQHMYNLILAPDVNTNRKYQWFYFEVSNTKAQVSYVFNIINCDKSNTQYNHGMQPVLFSVKDATLGKVGWVRTGSDIFYYRNNYSDSLLQTAVYHTLSFTVRFPHGNDTCYIAYHYPYTYTRLMTYLYGLQANPPNNIYCSVDTLCYTLANNPVPVVTITAPKNNNIPIHKRKVVVLSSRVHPAESNASWAMEGTLRYLLQDETAPRQLRDEYVFKIVPMQNPEGVIYGSYRCGLTTEDLNRCWRSPDMIRHPEVFHVKAMVQKLMQEYKRPVSLYLDYHGHSRKRNFFLYGCSNKASWKKSDRRLTDNIEEYMHFPTVLAESSKALSLKSCKFNVEKNRESTARVAIWREFGIKCSYTVECTYCGFDVGPYKAQAINTKHLFEIGGNLMRALWLITSEAKRCKLSLPYLYINNKEIASTSANVRDENNDVTNNN